MRTEEMEKAHKRLSTILSNYDSVPRCCYKNLDLVKKIGVKNQENRFSAVRIFLVILFLFGYMVIYDSNLWEKQTTCLMEAPTFFSQLFRVPEKCDICRNITQIDRIHNVSSQVFDRLYIKTSKPVIVEDATQTWKAMQAFDFEFFKNLYSSMEEDDDSTCQFFPYNTEFKSLTEALEMTPERVKMKPGEKPWYIGWSNCFKRGGNFLQEYHSRPYFLPDLSENIALNWIFMGTPGKGASLHVDNVHYPSWQAQIKGVKEWHLAPPPECTFQCKSFRVIMKPGDMIVVDTNKWYHETEILPEDISITIGSEFD